jgi:uncharacterized DUF497 family protein
MRFEWDETKNASNQKKHGGVDFSGAALAFADPDYVLVKDCVDENGEQRYQLIGRVELRTGRLALLLVVHVYRKDKENGEEIVRIISAREANKRERRRYIQQGAQ